MEIVIQESKWTHGELCVKKPKGYCYCAMGFMGKALKIPNEVLIDYCSPLGMKPDFMWPFIGNGLTEKLDDDIINTNDESYKLTNKKKKALRVLFKEMGHTLKFIK